MNRRFFLLGAPILLGCFFIGTLFFSGIFEKQNPNVSDFQRGKTIAFSLSEAEISHDLHGTFTVVGGEIPAGNRVFFKTDIKNEWTELLPEKEEDIPDFEENEKNTVFAQLSFVDPSSKFSFRIEGAKNSNAQFSFFFFDTRSPENDTSLLLAKAASGKADAAFFEENGIISRAEWSANEDIRYASATPPIATTTPAPSDEETPPAKSQKALDCENLQNLFPEEFTYSSVRKTEDGKKLRWSYEYSSKIEKIVLHHTAENGVLQGRDPKEVMRAIYSYHANSRGWGDIGYNFVIDPYGNIYEGRAGGDYIVGGHTYCANTHTIGISMMGNFENEEPSELQMLALQSFLPSLGKKYNLDVTGMAIFHGKGGNNVLGHRDLGATACPGKNLYNRLSDLLRSIANGGSILQIPPNSSPSPTPDNVVLGATFFGSVAPIALGPGEKKTFSLQFRNMGNTSWEKKSAWIYALLPETDISFVPPQGMPSYTAGALRESSVPPGSIGTFDITLQGGKEGGLSTVEFSPFVGAKKIEKASVVVPVQTIAASYAFTEKGTLFSPTTPKKDVPVRVTVTLLNTGNVIWRKGETSLEIISARTKQRFRLEMTEAFAGSHETVHFSGNIGPFVKNGSFSLVFQMKAHGGSAPGATSFRKVLRVNGTPTDSATFVTSDGKTVFREVFPKNSIPKKIFTVKNTGDAMWDSHIIQMKGKESGREFFVSMNEQSVSPGQTATFLVALQNPLTRSERVQLEVVSSKKGVKGGLLSWMLVPKKTTTASASPTPLLPSPTPIAPKQANTGQGIDAQTIRIRLGFLESSATVVSEKGQDFSLFLDGKLLFTGKESLLAVFSNLIAIQGSNASIVRIIPADGDFLRISSWNRIPSWDKTLNDNIFRGVLEFRVENGNLFAINELPLGKYLQGLAEVTDTTPTEKQKAIAVVARSYAAYYLSNDHRKYPGAPYDGDDSPNSFQKYLGYGYEKRSSKFVQAVENTKNEVVTYNGALVKTPFFSESDGRTKSAKEVWGFTDTPYLVSVPDPFCKDGKGTQSGHGVGLSGCGADGMARAGKGYVEILEYYYKGIKVEKK